MATRAPDALEKFWTYVHARIPSSKLGGICGDAAHQSELHTYHISRQDQRGGSYGGYSVEPGRNQGGRSDLAAGFDLTLTPALMVAVTSRLHKAALAHDPRLAGLAEFCGTLDNRNTYPWDMRTNSSEGVGSWDDSHLWHVHLSFYRDTVNNWSVVQRVADVVCGIPSKPGRYPLLKPRRFRAGDSSFYVAQIQTRLAALGFYTLKVDGDYGPGTVAAVNAWKRQCGYKPDGKFGPVAWSRLMNTAHDAHDRKAK